MVKLKYAGAAGQDLIIKVPVGTVIRLAANGEIVADLSQPGQTLSCTGW